MAKTSRCRGHQAGVLERPCTRRQLLGGVAAAAGGLGLASCSRFDATSWFTRERYDVDERFRQSMGELDPPLPPQLANTSRWSALVISDLHFWDGEYNTSLLEVADYLENHPVDFLFQLGDLADAGYGTEYATAVEMLDAFDLPYYCALGNHDVWHEGWIEYKSYFGPSVYRLGIGNEVLFITIDLAGGTLGGLQRPWFEQQLAEATHDHIIVTGHYPLWTPTSEGFSQLSSEQEVYDILNLLRRYRVDAHLSGHTHRWAYTEFAGCELITLGSMKEGHADRCALRIDLRGGELTYTRIPFPFVEEDE